ncbi:hypothetical protein LTR56_022995 [Elasticomyces elasticus]
MSQFAGRAFYAGFTTEVIKRLRKQSPEIPMLETPAHEGDEIDILPSNRCGRPHEADFRRGRKDLFLTHLLHFPSSSPATHVTLFTVVREMIFSFWEDDVVACGGNDERRGSVSLGSDVEADTEDVDGFFPAREQFSGPICGGSAAIEVLQRTAEFAARVFAKDNAGASATPNQAASSRQLDSPWNCAALAHRAAGDETRARAG